MNAEPWVTASEVAQHLGVVKDTVYRMSCSAAISSRRGTTSPTWACSALAASITAPN